MDMNTITATVRTTEPDHWQPGDAWLAGGTVLFSYGSSTLTRLLDISAAGWPAIGVSEDGIELAATCTIAELYQFPAEFGHLPVPWRNPDVPGPLAAGGKWPALALVRPCCDSFVASFKIWNMSTVGGNICTALPAGPMTSLTTALDGEAVILGPGGNRRTMPVAELVIGDGQTALADGELLRSVFLPAAALRARVAFRRLSLSNLGRSGVLLIGRLDVDGRFTLTVTAATKRPVRLRFAALPTETELEQHIDEVIPAGLYHDDIHGLPQWRRDMTYKLAADIRAELGGEFAGAGAGQEGHRK